MNRALTLLIVPTLFLVHCKSSEDIESLSTLPNDSSEAVSEVMNTASDALDITAPPPFAPPIESAFTSQLNCLLSVSGTNPRVLTLGSGTINGTFADTDYDLANWDLTQNLPVSLASASQDDFDSSPTATDPCIAGVFRVWYLSGTVSRDFDTGRIVKHTLRQLAQNVSGDLLEGYSDFIHGEITLTITGSYSADLSDLSAIRGRWINGTLARAQAINSLGTATLASDSDSGGAFLEVSGNACVHHLIAERFSYHEIAGAKRYTGFAGYCCHPLGGSDTFSVYPNDVSCRDGEPPDVPERKYRVTYPDSCGGDLTIEQLNPTTDDVEETSQGEALCNSVGL